MSWWIIKDETLGLPLQAPGFPAFTRIRPMLAWEHVEDAEAYLDLQRIVNTDLANRWNDKHARH